MTEQAAAVLVVDDEPEMRELLRDELSERGYRVAAATNGRDALKKLGEDEYAVVLTDLRMQGMQGLELLGEVKRDHPVAGSVAEAFLKCRVMVCPGSR